MLKNTKGSDLETEISATHLHLKWLLARRIMASISRSFKSNSRFLRKSPNRIQGSGRSPGEEYLSTPIFLPEQSHGERSLEAIVHRVRVWHDWETEHLICRYLNLRLFRILKENIWVLTHRPNTPGNIHLKPQEGRREEKVAGVGGEEERRKRTREWEGEGREKGEWCGRGGTSPVDSLTSNCL